MRTSGGDGRNSYHANASSGPCGLEPACSTADKQQIRLELVGIYRLAQNPGFACETFYLSFLFSMTLAKRDQSPVPAREELKVRRAWLSVCRVPQSWRHELFLSIGRVGGTSPKYCCSPQHKGVGRVEQGRKEKRGRLSISAVWVRTVKVLCAQTLVTGIRNVQAQ